MLPKIDVPIYELKLVSTKNPIRFRPFLVKEQKLLLMAQEAINSENGDSETVMSTVKQVINNCVLSEIDIDELPLFDIEYLFLNLRARSIGEDIKISYRCANTVTNEEGEEKKCNHISQYDINLLDIKPEIRVGLENKIEINEKMGMLLKYPRINSLKDVNFDNEESILNLIINCIEGIYDEETIYYAKDVERAELVDFIDSLPTTVLEKVKQFFMEMPKIKKEFKFNCVKCGYEEDILLEGLNSFFV
jgi:hypothetical protein